MASAEGQPLSLRPFPVPEAEKKPQSISDFIARINAQPGGFRSVTEEKLRQDIADEEANGQNGAEQDDDVDMSESGDEEEETKDPNAVRLEVLKNIEIAGNTAMLTLDSLSLLLSKQNPTLAGVTLSTQLRDMVGIGTMGADRLEASNVTPEKTRDKESIATGWTIQEINETGNAAAEAAKFLQKEIGAEGRYWQEILKVQKSGWAICKMPQERHALGVRFGFSEAAPEFRNLGLAPMRRGENGTVELDSGRLGGISERLQVTYLHDGEVVGRSSQPVQTSPDAPLESRVLEARNTLFAQELWHELTKEAKTLTAHDVRSQGSSKLKYTVDEQTTICLELVPLESIPTQSESLPQDKMAETICIALHLLLSYSHRYNELMRVRPLPPHIPRSRGSQTCTLLRPIIARLQSTHNIRLCTQYIGLLTQALHKAGLPATFILRTPQPEITKTASGPNQPSASQILMRTLLQPIEFSLKVTLLPDVHLTIRARTFIFPVTATNYNIILPPSSPLQHLCPPYKDGCPDVRSLTDYIRTATSRLLTHYFLNNLRTSTSEKWSRSITGTSIRSSDRGDDFELRFAIDDTTNTTDTQPLPVLVLQHAYSAPSTTTTQDRKQTQHQKWQWRADGTDTEEKTLEEIVKDISEQVALSR